MKLYQYAGKKEIFLKVRSKAVLLLHEKAFTCDKNYFRQLSKKANSQELPKKTSHRHCEEGLH